MRRILALLKSRHEVPSSQPIFVPQASRMEYRRPRICRWCIERTYLGDRVCVNVRCSRTLRRRRVAIQTLAAQLMDLLLHEPSLASDRDLVRDLHELARLIVLWSERDRAPSRSSPTQDTTEQSSTAQSSQPAQRTYQRQPESEPANSEWAHGPLDDLSDYGYIDGA